MLSIVFVAASLALLARADVEPTEPAPGDNFTPGGQCTFSWTPDTTGTWKTTYVELMSGSNANMTHLTTVTSFDGTDTTTTSYSWTCPDVTPHSPAYFYQFTSEATAAGGSPTWTGRFSISNGDLVATSLKDANGIGYDNGALVDPSTAVAAPPTSPEYSGSASSSVSSTSQVGTTSSASSNSGSTSTSKSTSTSSSADTTSAGSSHAMPGVTQTSTTTGSSSTSTSSTGDAVSLRGSFAALAAAGAMAVALL